MKKILLFLFVSISCHSQIKKIKTDLYSIEEKEIKKYINKTLYLDDDPIIKSLGLTFYKDCKQNEVYMCCDSYNNSKYNAVINKYYSVIGYEKCPNKITGNDEFYMKIVEKESSDTIFFLYRNNRHGYEFPFIIKEDYDKEKNSYLEKKFILKSTYNLIGIEDINTKEEIKFKKWDKWKCIDYVKKEYEGFGLLIQNDSKQTFFIEKSMMETYTLPAEKIELYKKKFGLKFLNDILDGNVSIGMTKEICELAWGKPSDINKTVTKSGIKEQWVYSKNYLYFTNGKLTAIQ